MMYLIDCYHPVLRLVCEFSQPERQNQEYDDFREQTLEIFQQSIVASQQLAISATESDDALFAMTVWFDEMVLRSELPFKHYWRNQLLQTHFFNTVIGGEEFFSRLDNIDDENIALRMVYLNCLLLGFHGKYHHRDSSELLKRIAVERLNLPAPWHEWPNNAVMTQVYLSEDKKENGILSRVIKRKYSMVFFLVVEYGLLSGMLLTLF
ncbi:hypothetical protein M977_00194 [Buttiauxella gaviniae ATCC 51604]|uniref:Type IV / VI secretion system DotU domain-containing protein n=1 Tax=Buttiauxella gaviniae ATCC 51604 TaxID=1354253 RepID=A0A1B7I6B0_9ENTR|nr:DotU family type IV/VI secretion system protein [Buttiauxella gaviniae]OAT23904.1 hypothetical protein M977_00194 [Buttiauxella gaviniae ATCC 51604]